MEDYTELEKFFNKPTKTANVRQFLKDLLTLNSTVKREQAQLKTMRDGLKDTMNKANINRLVGVDDAGVVYTVSLSKGGNWSKEFDLERFRKENPALYKKYCKPAFSLTSQRMTIKEYVTPEDPCIKCTSNKRCETCGKHILWRKKWKETMEQKAIAEREETADEQ